MHCACQPRPRFFASLLGRAPWGTACAGLFTRTVARVLARFGLVDRLLPLGRFLCWRATGASTLAWAVLPPAFALGCLPVAIQRNFVRHHERMRPDFVRWSVLVQFCAFNLCTAKNTFDCAQ